MIKAFIINDRILSFVGGDIYKMYQDLRPFYVAQESVTKAPTLMSTFYKARYFCDNKYRALMGLHYTQNRLFCGKRITCYSGMSARDPGYQRGFSGVRMAYYACVGYEPELQKNRLLFAGGTLFAWAVFRVSSPAAAPSCYDDCIARLYKVSHDQTGIEIF